MRRAFPKSTVEYLDRLPPYVCRMIARYNHIAMSTDVIAARSLLSRRKVLQLSKLRTFASVPVAVADNFRAACGITWENERQHYYYLIRTRRSKKPFAHLDRLSVSERAMINRAIGSK